MYRFLLRPAWLASHVLVAALMVVLVTLGFWQLRRLDERKDLNATVEARTAEPVVPIAELVDPGADTDVADEVEWRPVTATGTFDPDTVIRVVNRTFDGAPGEWRLVPLRLADGTTLLVNRGFVARADDASAVVSPPAVTVTVEGLLRASQTREGLGVEAEPGAELREIPRVDVDRLETALTAAGFGPTYPLWLQLTESSADGSESGGATQPRLLPGPDLSDGPHLSYAGQWFVFAAIAVFGYPMVLRRVARASAGVGTAAERRSTVPVDEPPPIPHG